MQPDISAKQKAIHRVKTPSWASTAGRIGKLRWYGRELHFDCNLRVEDERPDGTCFVYGSRISLEHKPYPEMGQIHHLEESLEQNIVDKIEQAEQVGSLIGIDFIVFENSPHSEQWYRNRTL